MEPIGLRNASAAQERGGDGTEIPIPGSYEGISTGLFVKTHHAHHALIVVSHGGVQAVAAVTNIIVHGPRNMIDQGSMRLANGHLASQISGAVTKVGFP